MHGEKTKSSFSDLNILNKTQIKNKNSSNFH